MYIPHVEEQLYASRSFTIFRLQLNYRLHAFTSRAAKINFLKLAASRAAKFRGKFTRQFRNMALQHRWAAPIQFVMQGRYHAGMAMAKVVNAIAGKKIQNSSAIGRK
jgi:hypothetical protein